MIQESTHCSFARTARICGAPEWVATLPLEDNVDRALPSFLRFLRVARDQRLDGYVFEAVGDEFGSSIQQLARTTRRVLTYLSERDPAQTYWFSLAGERLFVLTFAPCYGTDSSRYGFEQESTFILFQPEHSFDRKVPPGQAVIPDFIRRRIRDEFAAHNRSYDLAITLGRYEAHRYVKPLRFGDPIVRWWEEEG